MPRSDYERIKIALLKSGRALPWLTSGGMVLVWLFGNGGWHAGPVATFLEGLKEGERDAVLFARLRRVHCDPMEVLNGTAVER